MENFLETERLRMAAVTVADAKLMLTIWNDPDFVRNVTDRGIRSMRQARRAVRKGPASLFDKHGYGPFTLELKASGEKIGICGYFQRKFLPGPDIGYALLPEWTGKGYAGEAARAVLEHAGTTLRLPSLWALTRPDNKPSVGLLQKLGFERQDAAGLPDDMRQYALFKRELGNPQSPAKLA